MIKNKKPKITFTTQEDFEKKFYVNNPEAIESFFNTALEDYVTTGDKEEFHRCMKLVVKWNGLSKIAEKSKITRQGLHKALSPQGNPSFGMVISILRNAGYHFNVSYSGK
ncbi:MAG: hypothetical protein LBI01_00610 [Elusimicrobium sp.]|jgi:probable addiction module antidote protein|nr:hypothetical protein [Elusimicrobium sp.]